MNRAASRRTRDPGTAAEADPPRPVRPVLFQYPALPKPEIYFYFAVLIGIVSYGWYCVYEVSSKFQFNSGWGKSRMVDVPILGNMTKDVSNWEWERWRPMSFKLIPALIIHSLWFNIGEIYLGPGYRGVHEKIGFIYSLVACCVIFNYKTVLMTLGHGFFIYLCTRTFDTKLSIWLSSMPMLYSVLHIFWLLPHAEPFIPMILCSYKLLSYISYNIEYLDGKSRPQDNSFLKGLYRMYYFAFYLPYLISLIVLYPDFERQINERVRRQRDWRWLGFFALRWLFWYLVCDAILYFFYFEAILYSPKTLRTIREDQLTAMGYAIGQFFHLKYVVIFGLNRLFAHLDNMQPPGGPICISRVALYSKIWRSFDRGLYAFFKEYIFLPICRPTFSVARKLAGLATAYAFVLLWHGLHHHNFVWIILNVAELLIEAVAKFVYTIPSVRLFRERNISDRNFRRILGWLQIVPFAFALYSNFYFLSSNSETGWVFVDRIFWQETVPMHYPFWLLIMCGYCYTNVCMECDRYLERRNTTNNITVDGGAPGSKKKK